MPQSAPQFRPDIQGLRAIAVMAVTLFHFKVPGLSGGYVGVDIFFVISGFLMTSILLRRLGVDSYTYWGFVWSRAARIYPPLVALLLVLLGLGYFFLDPSGYDVLGKGSLSAVASAGNVYFYLQSLDYFAPNQQSNWLLHLWSLGVEAQFYVLYPLALAFAYRRGWARGALWAIFIVSLLLSGLLTPRHQSATFFLLPARAWEFAAGGLAFLYQDSAPRALRRLMLPAGLAAIAVAVFGFREAMAFPGWLALVPVVGTAVVIATRSESRILVNPMMQFLGDVSYSTYLWHWPLWVAAYQYRVPMTAATITAFVVGSIVLGTLSYYLVEVPSNRRRHAGRRGAMLLAGLSCCAATATATAVVVNQGYPMRVPDLVRDVIPRFQDDIGKRIRHGVCFLERDKGPDGFANRCFERQATKKTVFIWGDSFAAHLWFGFEADEQFAALSLLGATTGGCFPTLKPLGDNNSACATVNEFVFKRILEIKPDVVVLFARWEFALDRNFDTPDAIARTVEVLHEHGIPSVVVGPEPEWLPTLPQRLLQVSFSRGGLIPDRLPNEMAQKIHGLDTAIASAVRGRAQYVSLYGLLCNKDGCRTTVHTPHGRELLTYDFGHLTVPAAQLIASKVGAAMSPILSVD